MKKEQNKLIKSPLPLHPLTANWCQMMQAAHDTITDESQPLVARRFALLVMDGLDQALSQQDIPHDAKLTESQLNDYIANVPELPHIHLHVEHIGSAANE